MNGTLACLAGGVLLAAFILWLGWMVSRLPKCPRCGAREWIPCRHLGTYAAYCKRCLKQVDFANWTGKS